MVEILNYKQDDNIKTEGSSFDYKIDGPTTLTDMLEYIAKNKLNGLRGFMSGILIYTYKKSSIHHEQIESIMSLDFELDMVNGNLSIYLGVLDTLTKGMGYGSSLIQYLVKSIVDYNLRNPERKINEITGKIDPMTKENETEEEVNRLRKFYRKNGFEVDESGGSRKIVYRI